MKMWSRLRSFFRREPKATPQDVLSRIPEELRQEVLDRARFLSENGVAVRDLLPGEVPSEDPELSDTPYRSENGRLISD